MSTKVKRQEKLNMMEEKDFRRRELLEKYMAKMLYRWDDGKFEEKYLKKLKRNWQKWKIVFLEKKSWEEVMSELRMIDLDFILFYFPFILSYIKKG